MKRRLVSMFLMLSVMLTLLPSTVLAADETVLVATEKVTLYADSTAEVLEAVYGDAKLKTPSRYGGYAYSFYNDDYADYIYIETTEAGKIALFSVFGEFTSYIGNGGDSGSSRTYSDRAIYADYRTGKIWGVTGLYLKNLSLEERKMAVENFNTDARYGEWIAQHTARMWNAVAAYYDMSETAEFDRATFYINRQLMENGSTFFNYCRAIGSAEFSLISCGGSPDPEWTSTMFKPNPFQYAYYAKNYNLANNSYLVCDWYGGMDILGALNKSYFTEGNEIPCTEEETALIEKMQAKYAASVEQWNNAVGDYYQEEPQYEQLPLTAGKIDPECIEAAVEFLNVIRVGAGLPELSYSEALSEGSQHKAVLTRYLAVNNISNPSPHFPPQPTGVSDEFYEKAQSGGGENLYQGNALTSIINALCDSGDMISCGHRYNLLAPTYQEIGLGEAGGQGVHKFSGYQAADVDVVAWPSKGIMISGAGAGSGQMYTVKFYNGLRTTEDSGIIFKCLNTGETITFESGMTNTNSRRLYSLGGMIAYYDSAISMAVGNVYEITVTNVKDPKTGQISDYSYRSRYVQLYEETEDTELTMSADTMSVRLGATKKLSAVISPEDAGNKMVTWATADPGVATVDENGHVTGVSLGSTTITAAMDNGTTAVCEVTVRQADAYDAQDLPVARTGDYTKLDWFAVTNRTQDEVAVRFLIAAYDDQDRMLTCSSMEETLAPKKSAVLTIDQTVIDEAARLRAFVLDPETLKPLREAWELTETAE